MTDNDALIGKQLGAYQIQAKLGEGGMARVYRAYHARLRRDVAIKVILPQAADKPGFKERFEQEAQVVARLEQRNIVAVYDFGESGNLTYLVMQYVGGGTLRDQLRGQRPLELRRAVAYAQQMARALHHGVRDQSIDPHGREHERQHREHAEQREREPLRGEKEVQHVAHRPREHQR